MAAYAPLDLPASGKLPFTDYSRWRLRGHGGRAGARDRDEARAAKRVGQVCVCGEQGPAVARAVLHPDQHPRAGRLVDAQPVDRLERVPPALAQPHARRLRARDPRAHPPVPVRALAVQAQPSACVKAAGWVSKQQLGWEAGRSVRAVLARFWASIARLSITTIDSPRARALLHYKHNDLGHSTCRGLGQQSVVDSGRVSATHSEEEPQEQTEPAAGPSASRKPSEQVVAQGGHQAADDTVDSEENEIREVEEMTSRELMSSDLPSAPSSASQPSSNGRGKRPAPVDEEDLTEEEGPESPCKRPRRSVRV
ncbi:hypothetical protein NUW54_g10136 [Trametes sanguinea]|uniref:Uncharacterized protein n=1 Tax=Trametes sanguinea TaxID=158606 RepID=A0ACC1P2S2_9APHY|nr:hypothetical protein NUW54_g10136 [Trametes sanguinea]